jgi:glutaminyl-peptide cyclotransferase
MTRSEARSRLVLGAIVCGVLLALGCKSGNTAQQASDQAPFMGKATTEAPAISPADQPPPPDKVDGFDGMAAYDQMLKQVSFGPRPAGSAALAKLQDYLQSELKSYGCAVDTDSFSADTPAGRLPMKNIVAKIPGTSPGIILLGTHYDTKRLDNFVGADDAGSSTGVMLEMARLLCAQKEPQKYAVWIAFFDGEEAVNWQWKDPDNRYGSRQMAAQMAARGDLKKIKVMLLADLVGNKDLILKREDFGTKAFTDLVWKTAQKLGYSAVFVDQHTEVSDDHLSFLDRGVPAVDLINLDTSATYWHTPGDTPDKISPKSLAIVGHTLLETIKELQKK